MPRSTAVLDDLRAQRDEARNTALALMEGDDYDPNSEALRGVEERSASLDGQIERLVRTYEQQSAADALDGRLSRSSAIESRQIQQGDQSRSLSWGEQFTRSEQFSQYPGRGTSQRVEVLMPVEHRALPHTLASMAEALPSVPIYDTTPIALPPSLLPLVSVVNVSGNAVDFVTWSKVTAPAAPKSSAAIVPEGGAKPPIEWKPDVVSATLDTIAGSTSYSRQLAQDAAAIVSFINGELQREVSRKIEEEAQAALAAATLDTATGTDLLVALRKGMAVVSGNGFVSNGFTVSADDLAEMDIAAMNASSGGPVSTANYWGLTPVIDWTKNAGDPLTVGDFKAAVQHFRRTSVELFSTDSHSDHFTKNILDTIAEARCKTVVVRPAALVEVTAA